MKVWIFGDSFTDGSYNGESTKSWIDIVFHNKNINYENRSVSGQSNEGIFLSVIDSLDEIDQGDVVLISWSSNLRFLNLTESIDQFDTYLNSSKHHYDIWRSDSKIDLNTVSELHNNLSSDLKFSVCVNGMRGILEERKIKFKFINGHYDFNIPIDLCKNYFPLSSYRSHHPNLLKYFNKEIFIQFNNGYCLLNEFFLTQLEEVKNLNTVKNIIKKCQHHSGRFDYEKFGNDFLHMANEEKICIFADQWHLNTTGHKIFANKIKDIMFDQLNL